VDGDIIRADPNRINGDGAAKRWVPARLHELGDKRHCLREAADAIGQGRRLDHKQRSPTPFIIFGLLQQKVAHPKLIRTGNAVFIFYRTQKSRFSRIFST
jgi:hypothetical protein